jgi:hypothetical protein
MVLARARAQAEAFSGGAVQDAVLAVPGWLGPRARQAVFDAAALGGVHLLGLVNQLAATALDYTLVTDFARNLSDPNASRCVAFVDVGASGMRAAIASFKEVQQEGGAKGRKDKARPVPQFTILAQVSEPHVAGRELDLRIARLLLERARAQYTGPAADLDTPRVMANLMREARHVKEILSANAEIPVVVEGLVDSLDLRTTVTRRQFEEAAADVWALVVPTLRRLLDEAGLPSPANVSHVELVGGDSRVPRLQSELQAFFGGPPERLGRHLNGDEAAATGAAFYAASLHGAFRLREVRMRDIVSLPVSLRFDRDPRDHPQQPPDPTSVDAAAQASHESAEEDDAPQPTGTEIVLFQRGARLGSRKKVRIRRHNCYSYSFLRGHSRAAQVSFSSMRDCTLELRQEGGESLQNYTVSGFSAIEEYNYTGRPKVRRPPALRPRFALPLPPLSRACAGDAPLPPDPELPRGAGEGRGRADRHRAREGDRTRQDGRCRG